MATMREAVRSGILCEYRVTGWELREPIRKLYHHPQFFDSWADIDPVMSDLGKGKSQRTRLEHLETMFNEWRCDKRPSATELRRVMPTRKGVVKMHPFGSRVFGWFTTSGEFVAVSGALVEDTKDGSKRTEKELEYTLKFVRENGLEETMFKGEISEIVKKASR